MKNKFLEFVPLQHFDTIDDLYITSTGFEERNLGSTKKLLKNNFKTKTTIVVRYENYVNENENDLSILTDVWNSFSDEIRFVNYSADDRNTGIKNFKQIFSDFNLEQCNVTINISSFKTHVFVWMVNFLSDHCKNVRIVYTEPEGYDSQLENEHAFSSGVHDIFTMPEFSGAILPGYSTLLIAFLGYDFIRTRGVYDQIQPSKKIGIIATPNTKTLEKYFPILKSNHNKSFSKDDKLLTFPIFALSDLIKYLEKIRSEYIETSNISLALNGSKLHTLAAILFAKKYQDVQLIISTPLAYYPNNYSFGTGRTFQIDLSKSWVKKFIENFNFISTEVV